METIKFKFLFVSAFLCCIVLGSCNMQDYDIQIPERVFGKLNILQKDLTIDVKEQSSLSFEYQVTGATEQIKLETKIANNHYHSVLSYRSEELEWVDVSVFDIDLQEVIDKKNMNIIIEKHAKTLKKKYDAKTVSRISDILEGLPELLYNELGQKEYNNESTFSVFYHLAAFNTARRSLEKRWSGDCQCSFNSSYLYGKTPFFCTEDVMVSADWFYDFIMEKSEINKFGGIQFTPKSLLKYLSDNSGQFVSASIVDKLLREELDFFLRKRSIKERQKIISENTTLPMVETVKTRSESFCWPIDPLCLFMGVFCGSDCGCCGNYSGPCLYCDTGCLIHDLTCQECSPPSYCLSGCVPGPCY